MLVAFLLATQVTYRSTVTIALIGDRRVITTNGIPNHETGRFPNRNNPNRISEQNYHFSMTASPEVASTPTTVGHRLFAVAVNGVPFDALTAEYWDGDRQGGWNYEAIIKGQPTLGVDTNNAHVQPGGQYHYHASPTGLLKSLGASSSKMTLIAWAADGFPVYDDYGYKSSNSPSSGVMELHSSYRVKSGSRPDGPGGIYDGTFTRDWEYVKGLGDLDECNGRFGITPEFPKGTYYYVISHDYPYIPRKWKGTPDSSFDKRPPRLGGQG